MTEGTKSYFFGCHHFLIHPICVLIAWILEYKSVPRPWQIVCIFLHDIGHIGKQYLSDPREKAKHWELGADIAFKFYGKKGLAFTAGHASGTSWPRSKMWRADKRSWLVAPSIWLWWNYFIEFKGEGITKPPIWKKLVKENLKTENPLDSHELYLKNKT